jgi:hypothetical protein
MKRIRLGYETTADGGRIPIDGFVIGREELKQEAREAAERVFSFDVMGGNLHVAIDDLNLDDDTLAFCELQLESNEAGACPDQIEAERECLEVLRVLTMNERVEALTKT